ncbi:MAG: CDF family Co(II)/Ni(II) efflux transporter DmeF [Pseudotabrizicola sp.]|jgi:cation diffusion facilitator family transporter|uniref:CDF family Co(II)/Ni(II) efflux transporter DmeF n=1 Tax=Pseudotabrizicola sp. TaxID=2939647 RepID=UPI00271900C5|nr:CDF family Co(II)/Ni(II) efflux transporter DmeF [Pseudotabrizicola sp.]MDO9641203.1 CDF family Co(II)/Ni(II) efflux transporter DmeF [Pseudotabrizicola sp.]
MSPNAAAPHDHVFLGENHARNERRTWAVIALTATMMVAEISAGTIYGSMALLADGWHMSTHASALLITALAYRFARKHARNPRFTFGTGKLGDLAAFGSATVLAIVALLIGWESLVRLRSPVPISFDEAILVAVIGLLVNLVSAWLLKDDHSHHQGHSHHHAHDHGHGHGHNDHDHDHGAAATRAGDRDNNLRAAYLHVLADALTSVLAIAALLAGRSYGWVWLDPVIGIVGALVILSWSWGLLRDSGSVLMDYLPDHEDLPAEVRAAIESEHDEIVDLHVWQLGPGHHGAIIALKSTRPEPVAAYRARLRHIDELSHVTVEIHPA